MIQESYHDYWEIVIAIMPALITAFVSIIAMLTSYKTAKNTAKQSFDNNVDNMRFTQKEKVADQIAEKAAILLTKCDPNVLNTLINEFVPKAISHEENANIRRYLYGRSDEIQTYSNIIKMLIFSISEDREMVERISSVGQRLDNVNAMVSDMLFKLANIYTAMTPEGRIKSINVTEEKIKLEVSFSEQYKEPYLQLFTTISELVWYIRQKSIPKNETPGRHKVKKEKKNRYKGDRKRKAKK